ncbi:MAG: tetratricopeptide repeat protein, partial [Verrucomicrobiota bacterium]
MKVPFSTYLLFSCIALLGTPSVSFSQEQIRAVPIQPQEELFKFANLLYGNQNFEEAAPKYMRFLTEYPKSVNAPTAWYRLGDCQRRLKNVAEAKKAFQQVLKLDPNGPFAGFASYAMAVYTFNENKFDASLPYFRIATNKLKDPKISLEAQFFYAQALQLAKSNEEAIAAYKTVLASKVPNLYRERSELELAKLLLAAGKKDESTKHFTSLAANAKDPSIRDEATFKAGILGLDSANPEKAEAFLLSTLKNSTSNPDFRAQAQLALLLRANDRNDLEKVTVYYGAGPLGKEKSQSTAQMMLIAANAYRKLNKLAKAIEIYGKIESDQNFRKLPEGRMAGFQKLNCFLEAGDPDIARWVDKYVANQSEIDPDTPFIDLALLIKAERLYENKDYKNAAVTYRNVRPSNIDPKYVPARHYKMGWALIESGNEPQGLDILGEFASDWPDDPRVPSALVKRAMTFQTLENYEDALSNYQTLTKRFPSDPNSEFSMQQIALIHAQLQQIRPMVEAYSNLLKRFPNTPIKAEAHYWIGGGLFDLKDYKPAIPA